jgi:putative glutamine amidotransferase
LSLPIIGIAAWRQTVEVWEYAMSIFQADELYVQRVRAAGGLPVLLPHLQPNEISSIVTRLDGLILTGGDDIDPSTYGAEDEGVSLASDATADQHEIALLNETIENKVPVLAICRGAQILNVSRGGTLEQEMTGVGREHHPKRPDKLADILAQRHPVEIDTGSKLAAALHTSTTLTNSTHHQAISTAGEGLTITGRAPDGTVEAIETDDDAFVVGVQWHPEKLPPPEHQGLFDALVCAASSS